MWKTHATFGTETQLPKTRQCNKIFNPNINQQLSRMHDLLIATYISTHWSAVFASLTETCINFLLVGAPKTATDTFKLRIVLAFLISHTLDNC